MTRHRRSRPGRGLGTLHRLRGRDGRDQGRRGRGPRSGLVKEDERYDLTVQATDRSGNPAGGWVGIGLAGDSWPWAEYVDGQTTLRLPPGTYRATTSLDVPGEGPDRSGVAVLLDPETVLDQDREISLDARDTRLLQTDVRQDTEDRQRKVDFAVTDSTGVEYRQRRQRSPTYDDIYVSTTSRSPRATSCSTTRWRKAEPMFDLAMPDGETDLRHRPPAGSKLGTGTRTAPTAYAGTGAAADYDGLDVNGAIVVVDRSDDVAGHGARRPRAT